MKEINYFLYYQVYSLFMLALILGIIKSKIPALLISIVNIIAILNNLLTAVFGPLVMMSGNIYRKI